MIKIRVENKNQRIFDNIYKRNKWYFGSGSGSIAKFNKPFINFVNQYLETHPDIQNIIDLGCGDWQIAQHFKLEGKKYIGVDVSWEILKKIKKKYETPTKAFVLLDITTDEIPEGDLVIIKDVLQHLSNKDIQKILPKLNKYKHVIIANSFHNKIKINDDVKNGKMRRLDIRKPPFDANQYVLSEEYTETLVKPINLIRQFLFMPKVKIGIFLKTL